MKFPQEVIESLIKGSHPDHKGENVYGYCPYCGENEFGISLKDNHLWRCFRGKKCGETGNIFKLLKYLGRTELYRDKDYYRETDVFAKLEKRSLVKIGGVSGEVGVELPSMNPPIGWKRIDDHPYLRERGFTDVQFEKYEIGTTRLFRKLKGYVVFLVRQDGEVKAYVSRSTKTKDEIDDVNRQIKERNSGKPNDEKEPLVLRYANSTDADFSKIMYGIDEAVVGVTHTVIIVEGLFDKINLEIVCPELFEDKSIIVCCTWGKKISSDQIRKMEEKEIENAILIYDPDAVNDSKAYSHKLGHHLRDVRVGYLKEKDPGDLNKEEFMEVLENLVTPSEFSRSKIQKRQFF